MAGTPRRVAIVGGGPAGLVLARAIRLIRPRATVDVYERDGPEEAYGFGVGLADRAMDRMAGYDPQTHRRLVDVGTALAGVELRPPGAALRYDGFRLTTVARHALLTILREQAERAGARLWYHRETSADKLDADVVALADGAGSANRAGRFATSTYRGAARYIWLGTPADPGDTVVFGFVRTGYGPIAMHAYRCGSGLSTVVVETDEGTLRAAGLARAGEIDDAALRLLSDVFAEHLGGEPLLSNNSRWASFTVVRNERWAHGNRVLLGDAAHTAHFTVGSGTTLAVEDAIALATALDRYDDRGSAFAAYERERRPPAQRTQALAEPSMRWWETFGRRLNMPPAQFGMHFITRTGGISYLGLRRRCPERVDEAESGFHKAAGGNAGADTRNAAGAPLRLGPFVLANRLVRAVPEDPGGVPGVGLVLVRGALPATRPPGTVFGTVRADPTGTAGGPRFVETWCPPEPEWTPAADRWLRRIGARRREGIDGILLRDNGDPDERWYETIRYASRIRTEAGLAVAVCVPPDWSFDLARQPDRDPWPTRIHVALVSGRIDLVATLGSGWDTGQVPRR